MSILGTYRRDMFNQELTVGTPDPTKYHDISGLNIETKGGAAMRSVVPGSYGFKGLRGVMIPRATYFGGSQGFDHMAPMKAYIDPQLTNNQIVVDMAKIQADPNKMVDAIRRAFSKPQEDVSDAMIEAYGEFADPIGEPQMGMAITVPTRSSITEQTIRQNLSAPLESPNQLDLQKEAYGDQMAPANFSRQLQPQPGFGDPIKRNDLPVQPTPPTVRTYEAPRTSNTAIPEGYTVERPTTRLARSLQSEISNTSPVTFAGPNESKQMRKVIFELPVPGQPDVNMGQVTGLFHDVIYSKVDDRETIVLVYDHSHPAQSLYWPPVLEDPVTKAPVGMAILVQGTGGAPNMLYRAYPTGVQFTYRNEEFCILTVDFAKPYEGKV